VDKVSRALIRENKNRNMLANAGREKEGSMMGSGLFFFGNVGSLCYLWVGVVCSRSDLLVAHLFKAHSRNSRKYEGDILKSEGRVIDK
jgi:hypothetical protein